MILLNNYTLILMLIRNLIKDFYSNEIYRNYLYKRIQAKVYIINTFFNK